MEIITSRNNKKIQQITLLLRDAKQRKEQDAFVVEGVKLCAEAIASQCATELFITKRCLEKNQTFADNNITVVEPHVYDKLTILKSPEGVCAICKVPYMPRSLKKGGRYLVLFDIQNPDNAGAMIRTAASLNYDGVVVCKGVNITNPSLIRASAGAFFAIPLIETDVDNLFSLAESADIKMIATSPKAKTSLADCTVKDSVAILIGNEGNGLSEDIIARCNEAVRIEITGFESLNAAVAAGIIMYHFKG